MTDPNNAPDVLSEDSGDPEVRGAQIDDGVYIVNEWVQQAVPVAGLLAQATNNSGTLSEFLLSDDEKVIPPLRLFAPLLTGPNAGKFATRALTRVPGTYTTDNLRPEKAQELLLKELRRWTPLKLHAHTWKMTSEFTNNLAELPNENVNLAAANTCELWEISGGGQKRAVVYSWGFIDPDPTLVWFRDYCFSKKNGASAQVMLPLRLSPMSIFGISAVSSFQSQQISSLASARSDAASRLQVDEKQLGVGRLASTEIVKLLKIDAKTNW